MTPAKIYPFSIPAGGSFPLLVIGDYCKILTSSGALTLTGDTFGTIGPILAGQGVESSPFQRLVLSDNSGAVNSGTILIADNKFVDDRITGEVSVIDGGKIRTLTKSVFWAYGNTAAVVGSSGYVQLWNPVGNDKRIVIPQISYAATSPSYAIANLSYNVTPLSVMLGNGKNKLIGEAESSAEIRKEESAVYLGIASIADFFMQGSLSQTLQLTEPIILHPGKGLMIGLPQTSNVALTANFEFYEEAIL